MKCIQDEIPFEIPESWIWCRVYHIGNVLSGGTPSTSIKEYWHKGTINWFTPSFMSTINSRYVDETDIKISQEGLTHSSAKLFSDNSIIMSSRAPIGYLCINKTEACTSQGCKTIELYNKDILEFVFLTIKSNIDFLISIASGTTFKEISLKKFSDLLVPIPPLKEQFNIVNKYYELLNLNENIQKEYADICKVKINLKGKILDTFFSSSSSYKSYYENKKLSEVSKITMGQSPKGEDITNNASNDGLEFHQGKLDFGELFINDSHKYAIKYNKIAEPGSILFSVRAPVGSINFTDRKIAIGRGLCSILPYENMVDKKFLYYQLLYQKNYFIEKGTGSTFQAITVDVLKNSRMSICNIKIQKIIIKKIDKIFELIDNM